MSTGVGAAIPFGDVLSAAVESSRSQILLGLDPDPANLWPESAAVGDSASGSPAEKAAVAVADHCRRVIDATAASCFGVKLQLASFERLGAPGRVALGEAVAYAHSAKLLVLADGKRGDIGISATSYAASLLGTTDTPWGEVPGLEADAVTVNPLLGAETVLPFIETARERGRGVFMLARTSNPGAADIQDRQLLEGETVSDSLAEMVGVLGVAGSSGIADVGAVVGATVPGHLEKLRSRMPQAPILLPGVGAQGGKVEDLAPAWKPGRAGGLVTVSRSIVGAVKDRGGSHSEAAAAAAEELRETAWSLSA
jgi:orotidine-5'-phosphate decarboxylase